MGTTVRGGTGATPASVFRKRAKRMEEESRGVTRRTPFDEMSVAELRVWAQKYDVSRYAKLKKGELAEAVRVAFEEGG